MLTTKTADRSKWPIQGVVCERIHKLGLVIRNDSLVEDYEDKQEVKECFSKCLATEGFTTSLLELIDVSAQYTIEGRDHVEIRNAFTINKLKVLGEEGVGLGILQELSSLGRTLSEALWWSRYEDISYKMGTDCVLSIKTSMALFEKDERRDDILGSLGKLISLTEERHE